MKVRIFALLSGCLSIAAAPVRSPVDPSASVPIYFEPNRGQCPQPFLFHSPGLLLAPTEARMLLSARNAATIGMRLIGANPRSSMRGAGQQAGRSNYLFGD